MECNGTLHYYVTNLQGDVVAILDSNGASVVQYSYNAWGHPLTQSGTLSNTLGTHNPLRYRGYVFDPEYKLYYLESRYYNSGLGRFQNADVFTSTGQGLLGNNMYIYCNNNPVSRVDSDGKAFETIFDVITLGFSVAEVALNPYDPMAWIGLAGDLVDIIPFVTGVGETVRGLRFVDKAGDMIEIAESADDAIDTYRGLKKINKGTGKEVHHIVEKRFADALNIENTSDMLSIALSKADHKTYTKLWRDNIKYGTKAVDKLQVFQVAAVVYKGNPQLMGAAVKTLFMR